MYLRFRLVLIAGLVLVTTHHVPAWACNGTILKKGNKTIVIYQSASARNKHWVEEGGRRTKHGGSARVTIHYYQKDGYKKIGMKCADF